MRTATILIATILLALAGAAGAAALSTADAFGQAPSAAPNGVVTLPSFMRPGAPSSQPSYGPNPGSPVQPGRLRSPGLQPPGLQSPGLLAPVNPIPPVILRRSGVLPPG